MKRKSFYLLFTAFAATQLSAPAFADPESTVAVTVEDREFNKGQGSVKSITMEYKRVSDTTTLIVAPKVSERRAPSGRTSELGGDATIYQKWSSAFTTRTTIGASEDNGIEPGLNFAQDFTVKVAKNTTVTLGGRFARWQGNDVAFYSGGLRQYFQGGSVSYTLTRTAPSNSKAFFAHLANLTVQDGAGKAGKTALWLSYGGSSETRTPLGASLSGKDAGVTVQRTQPISKDWSLIPTVGYSRFAVSSGYLSSFNFGLGISLRVD